MGLELKIIKSSRVPKGLHHSLHRRTYLVRLYNKVFVGVEDVHKSVEEDLADCVVAFLVLDILVTIRQFPL